MTYLKQCSGKRIRNKSSVFKPLTVAKTWKQNFVQRILRIFWSVQTFVLPFVSGLYYGERSRGQNEMENSLLSFEVKRAAVAAFPINWISHTARSAPASFDSQQHITKIGDKIRWVMSLNLEILINHNFCPCCRRDCWQCPYGNNTFQKGASITSIFSCSGIYKTLISWIPFN